MDKQHVGADLMGIIFLIDSQAKLYPQHHFDSHIKIEFTDGLKKSLKLFPKLISNKNQLKREWDAENLLIGAHWCPQAGQQNPCHKSY